MRFLVTELFSQFSLPDHPILLWSYLNNPAFDIDLVFSLQTQVDLCPFPELSFSQALPH